MQKHLNSFIRVGTYSDSTLIKLALCLECFLIIISYANITNLLERICYAINFKACH